MLEGLRCEESIGDQETRDCFGEGLTTEVEKQTADPCDAKAQLHRPISERQVIYGACVIAVNADRSV